MPTDYTTERGEFLASKAKVYQKAIQPSLKAKTLVLLFEREWDTITQSRWDFIWSYTMGENWTSVASPEKHFVTDPVIKGKTHTGTWRLAMAAFSAEAKGLLLTLRRGWAQAIDWTESHLVGGSDRSATEHDVQVQFRNIDPAYSKTCIDDLRNASPVSDPTIQGAAFLGDYAISDITPSQADDGTTIITCTLARTTDVGDLATLAGLTPIRSSSRDIDHPWGPQGGYTSHNAKAATDGIILTYKRLSTASRATLEAFTDAEMESICPIDGYEFVARLVTEDETDHTLTLKLAFKRITRRAYVAGMAPDIDERTNPTTIKESRQRQWLGVVSTTAADAAVMADLLPTGTQVPTGYFVAAIRYSDNDDGTKSWTQDLDKVVKGTATVKIEENQTIKIRPHSLAPGTLARIRIVNENLAAKTDAYNTLSAGHSAYTLVDQEDKLQANGRWSVTYLYEYPIWTAWSASLAPTKERTVHPDQDDEQRIRIWRGLGKQYKPQAELAAKQGTGSCAVPTATPDNWKIFDVDVDDNEDGSITLTQTVGRVPNRVRSSGSASVDEIATSTLYTAADAPAAVPPAGIPGVLLAASNTPGDFGKTQARIEARAEGPPFQAQIVSSKDATGTVQETIYEHQYSPISATANGERVSASRSSRGRWGIVKRKEVPTARNTGEIVIHHDELEKVTINDYENQNAVPTDSSTANGITTHLQNVSQTPLEKWNYRKVKTQGLTRQNLNITTSLWGHVKETLSFYDNQTSAPDIAAGQACSSPRVDARGRWSYVVHKSSLRASSTLTWVTWGACHWRDGSWTASVGSGGGVSRIITSLQIVRPKTTHKRMFFTSEEAAIAAANNLGAAGVTGTMGSLTGISDGAWHDITHAIHRLDSLGNVWMLETHETEQIVIQTLTGS